MCSIKLRVIAYIECTYRHRGKPLVLPLFFEDPFFVATSGNWMVAVLSFICVLGALPTRRLSVALPVASESRRERVRLLLWSWSEEPPETSDIWGVIPIVLSSWCWWYDRISKGEALPERMVSSLATINAAIFWSADDDVFVPPSLLLPVVLDSGGKLPPAVAWPSE